MSVYIYGMHVWVYIYTVSNLIVEEEKRLHSDTHGWLWGKAKLKNEKEKKVNGVVLGLNEDQNGGAPIYYWNDSREQGSRIREN